MIDLKLVTTLDRVFALGGNHNTDKAIEIRTQLLDYIREEELFLKHQHEYNKNFVTAINAICFIDANNAYATTSARMDGYFHMKPFFEYLMDVDTWNYYELKLLVGSMNFIIAAEEAIELASKAVQAINRFKADQNTDVMEGYLALNLCSRLLYAKYFDDDVKVDLTKQFNNWLSRLEKLAETNHQLDLPFLITQIREAIFNQNQERILELCEELKENYEEDIENTVKNGISFYVNSKKYTALLGGEQ